MGAPKQKWTPQEEAALKAGVLKHGAGKWRTILKDPQFSTLLQLRSNVDLKDKWRNMSVVANWGSREKAKLALKRMKQVPKQDKNSMTLETVVVRSDQEIIDAKPLAVSSSSPPTGGSKRSIIRLDNLIMEAINNLEEPGGSNKTTIGTYIEEQYWAPPNFKRLLSAKLKYLTARGRLIKMKRKYRIAPASSSLSEKRRNISNVLSLKGDTGDDSNSSIPSRLHQGDEDDEDDDEDDDDDELAKMKRMSPQEAAEVAARAVAVAETAMAEAEEAARAAEAAEAEAEAAQAFAEAALKAFMKGGSTSRTMIRV